MPTGLSVVLLLAGFLMFQYGSPDIDWIAYIFVPAAVINELLVTAAARDMEQS